MSLAYPDESSVLSDIVGCDAFLEALVDQALRVRILENDPQNLVDALNMASRLEVFHIMGFAGPEGEKQIEIRTCRSRRQRIHRFGESKGVGRDCKTACRSESLNELFSTRSRQAAAGDHNTKSESSALLFWKLESLT